jgi:hypothetical protein
MPTTGTRAIVAAGRPYAGRRQRAMKVTGTDAPAWP